MGNSSSSLIIVKYIHEFSIKRSVWVVFLKFFVLTMRLVERNINLAAYQPQESLRKCFYIFLLLSIRH